MLAVQLHFHQPCFQAGLSVTLSDLDWRLLSILAVAVAIIQPVVAIIQPVVATFKFPLHCSNRRKPRAATNQRLTNHGACHRVQ
jgi:hypothetical protein